MGSRRRQLLVSEVDAMSVPLRQVEPTPPLGSVEGNGAIPPLESGDRLSRDEFERRYDAMPGLKKAELIAGVVQVPSPVRQRDHSGPHFNIVGWLFLYRARTPGVEGGDNASVRLDLGSMPQPDCLLFVSPNTVVMSRSTKTATWKVRRTSSPRSPPAATVTTSTISSGRTRIRGSQDTSRL